MENWKDIHEDFSEKNYWGKTYQQLWEDWSLTYQDAKEWIIVRFEPKDYKEVIQWKINNLTPQEAKAWIDIGLTKEDAEFATYLKQNNYTPETAFQKKSPAQTWLDWKYPQDQRNTIKELNLHQKNLTGTLDLSDFVNLENLNCSSNHLTEIKLPTNGEKLEILDLGNNNFPIQDLSFLSGLRNLRELYLRNNYFRGSLEFLKDMDKLENLDISDTDIDSGLEHLPDSVKYFYCPGDIRPGVRKIKTIYNLFTDKKGERVKLEENSSNIKNFPQKLQEYKYEKNKKLEEQLKKYGLCSRCSQPNTEINWCQFCDTSAKQTIGKLIPKQWLEWISYNQFSEIEQIGEGNFGKVYKAKWKDQQNKWVALKRLNNSGNIEEKFLQEVTYHALFDYNWVAKLYGISYDFQTNNYVMVMQYFPNGSLRQYLDNNHIKSSFGDKLYQLYTIAEGLKNIHEKGLIHRDFHSGNILNHNNSACYITDLGLCRPVNETRQNKIYGVMPYVAPEILGGGEQYAQASDVYSFGIIAYEVLSGLPPYYDREHDVQLSLAICQGLRPQFQIKIPQLLKDLIQKCWKTNPQKRPTADELSKTLKNWWDEINDDSDYEEERERFEFVEQYQEAEEFNENLPDKTKFIDYKSNIHIGAVYTSRLLPTKETSELLSNSLDADLDNLNLNDFQGEQEKISVEIKQEQTAQILHNPPKSN